jgi:WD40 repeat protein
MRPRGKDAWKSGIALTRQPKDSHMTVLRHPKRYRDAFSGSNVLATNSSILILASDQHDHVHSEHAWQFPLQVRDAVTLEVLRMINCGTPVWEVAICGPVGNEIIIITTIKKVIALYGNEEYIALQSDPTGYFDAYKILAKEDVLLVLRNGLLHIYFPSVNSKPFLELFVEFQIADPQDFLCTVFTWSTDFSEFGYCINPNKVCIWRLYDDLGRINPSHVQTLTSNEPEDLISALAFNEKFAALGQDNLGGILVFDRDTGNQLFRVCLNQLHNQIEEPDGENSTTALALSGKFMIASSSNGCSLGVWNLETGEHSFRSVDFFHMENGYPARMVQLRGLKFHSFVTTASTGELILWGFPESLVHEIYLESIQRREEDLMHQ